MRSLHDGDVLGSWLRNEVQPEGHAFDYQRDTDSPEELRSRPSVFVAGGMILKPRMYQKWKLGSWSARTDPAVDPRGRLQGEGN